MMKFKKPLVLRRRRGIVIEVEEFINYYYEDEQFTFLINPFKIFKRFRSKKGSIT